MQGQVLVEKEAAPAWLVDVLAKMESNTIKEVNLSRKSMGDMFARAIVQLLQKNTSVVSMDLSWNGLTAETAKSFSVSLIKNSTLRSLNLSSNSIDVDGAKALAEGLKQNKGLTTLKMSWNQLLDDGARYLASALTPASPTSSGGSSNASNLSNEVASSTRRATLSSATANNSAFAGAMHSSSSQGSFQSSSSAPYFSNSTLVSLELACNSIRDDGAKALFNALRLNPIFVDLNLEWNEISDDSLRHAMAPLIQANNVRSILLVSNDQLGSDTVKSIASSMHGNSSLQNLSLSGKFGDGGCKSIASALTRHHLVELRLNKCKMGDTGVQYLCTALMTNKYLRALNLSSNKIGNDGAKAIQLLLEANITLTSLDLSANRIGDSGISNIASALTTNFTLISLRLQQNEFSEGGKRAMETALMSNWSLTALEGMVSDRLTTLTKKRNRSTPTDNIHTSLGLSDWPSNALTLVPPTNPANVSSLASTSPTPKPNFDRLVTLVLNNNQLSHIPTSFAQLGSLKALVLSRNRLTSPLSPVLGNLTSLSYLDVRANQLESLPTEIASLKSLTKLDASYNRLLTLPPSLGACINLREILLFDNKLDVLPVQMARLNELKILDLRYNPLKFVLESVFPPKTHLLSNRLQIEKLFSYLSSLGEGEPTVLSRVKLMLVGDSNVGKTSLRKYLAAGEKAQSAGSGTNITTDGVDISDIMTKRDKGSSSSTNSAAGSSTSSSSSSNSVPTTFTAYDFAGQQLYYTTHQFFLSDKAIYLVVYNLAELIFSHPSMYSKAVANIEYWLKSIRVRAKYAPIVLVGTHLDEVGRERAEECFSRLKAAFKNYRVEEYFAVSTVKAGRTVTIEGGFAPSSTIDSASGSSSKHLATFCSNPKEKNIELIPFLTAMAERRKLVGQTVPRSCGQLIHYIEEFRRNNWSPLMRFEDFKKVIIGYNTMDISGTLSLLTSMGFCLYFENDLNLRDIVILNPQALANLMSAVITLRFNHVKDGRLSLEDFTQVYTSGLALEPSGRVRSVVGLSVSGLQDHIQKLLFLLEKFEVVFRLPSHLQMGPEAHSQITLVGAPPGSRNAVSLTTATRQAAIADGTGSTHVLVPCMLPSRPPNAFTEVQKSIRRQHDPAAHLLFSRTYKFQFMPFGFFSRLIVRVLNMGSSTICWGLWRDGFCLREVSPNEDINAATSVEPDLSLLESDYGCVWYDPMEYKMQVNVLSSKTGAAGTSSGSGPRLLYPFLDRLIRAIDALIDVFYAKEKEGLILENKSPVDILVSCSHCLRERIAKPTQYGLNYLLQAYLTEEEVLCGSSELSVASSVEASKPTAMVPVKVEEMIPDMILSHLPVLEDLVIEEAKAIGEGGFATVYKGSWNGVPVAVKQLKITDEEAAPTYGTTWDDLKEMATLPTSPSSGVNNPTTSASVLDEASVARFKLFHHEVFMMSAFEHPNLVRLYGIATAPFRIVMEYVPGSTLTNVIHHKHEYPSLSYRLKIKMALDIARGMACLHAAQPPVVHRDLRPQNVFVQTVDENAPVNVKVGDFGLAQHAFSTDLKQFLGSFFWLAPEVLTGDSAYSLKSDVYSYAMIVWELLTRQTPFSEFDEYFTTREQILSPSELADASKLANYREMGYTIEGNKIVLQEFRKQDVIDAIVSRNLRPSIPKDTPAVVKDLVAACWGPVINSRPDFSTIVRILERHLASLSIPILKADTIASRPSPIPSASAPKLSSWQRGSKSSAILRNQSSDGTTSHFGARTPGTDSSQLSLISESVSDESDDISDEHDEKGWMAGSIDSIREELEMELYTISIQSNETSPSLASATSRSSSNSSLDVPNDFESQRRSSVSPKPSLTSVPQMTALAPRSTSGAHLPRSTSPNSQTRPPIQRTGSNASYDSDSSEASSASRPKRPPPQPLMSQQRVGRNTLTSAERSASNASVASNPLPASESNSSAQLPRHRPALVRSLTTTPKTNAIQASVSSDAIPVSPLRNNPINRPMPSSAPHTPPGSSASPISLSSSPSNSNAYYRGSSPRATPPTATPSPPGSSPLSTGRRNAGAPPVLHTPPKSEGAHPTTSTSTGAASLTSSKESVSPSSISSSFAKALGSIKSQTSASSTGPMSPSGGGMASPSSGRRHLGLPSIQHVWDRQSNAASCLVKVPATNEIWLGNLDASLDLCDNAVNITGNASNPALGGSKPKIMAMAATEDHVWVGLDDGRVLVWDPLQRVIVDCVVNTNLHGPISNNSSSNHSEIRDTTPVTAIHAAARPNDSMVVWTAHGSGIIRQWMHQTHVATLTLPFGYQVSHIGHSVPLFAPPSAGPRQPSLMLPGSLNLNSSTDRASNMAGPSIWIAASPSPGSKMKGCKLHVTDSNLRLVTSVDAHPASSRIHSIISIGNKVWTSGDDGISIWNALTCALETNINPSLSPTTPSSSSLPALSPRLLSINCMTTVANPAKNTESHADAHPLVWAFSTAPHPNLFVYDSFTLNCLHTTPLSQIPASESPKLCLNLTKDRVITLTHSGLLSLWAFQKPDRLSKHLPSGSSILSPSANANGSGKMGSARRPLRQAPSSPLHPIDFK